MNDTPIIYIAGPVSGQANLNRPAFYTADGQLKAKGFITRNPHEFCADIKATESDDPKYYRRCLAVLATDCTDILMLDGWQYSVGACFEHNNAKLFQMKIHYSIDELIESYTSKEETDQ